MEAGLRLADQTGIGAPAASRAAGKSKKKMRSLGSVQLPTEAFLAVLKLDECSGALQLRKGSGGGPTGRLPISLHI